MTSEWHDLANTYESYSIREDSFDSLLDYPAQKRSLGDVSGKSILDLGCGSGRKALDFVHAGAAKVVGIDISSQFVKAWRGRNKPKNLYFYQGDLSRLEIISELVDEQFDIVTCFQALGYSTNLDKTVAFIRKHIHESGRFILSTAHPFRFAIERYGERGIPYGIAYRKEDIYEYPSTWDKSITVRHNTRMISTTVNSVLRNGFHLIAMHEPDLSEEQKAKYPHKAEWLAKYIGIIVYEFTAVKMAG